MPALVMFLFACVAAVIIVSLIYVVMRVTQWLLAIADMVRNSRGRGPAW
jgi:hypothetical protein